jgi:hypothetical protein
MKSRITLVDGSTGIFKNLVVREGCSLVQAIDDETNKNTYIPMARIHKWVEIFPGIFEEDA